MTDLGNYVAALYRSYTHCSCEGYGMLSDSECHRLAASYHQATDGRGGDQA